MADPPIAVPDERDMAEMCEWLDQLAGAMEATDYVGARTRYLPDHFFQYGATYPELLRGLDDAQAHQWEDIWPHVSAARFDHHTLAATISTDRCWAVIAGTLLVSGDRFNEVANRATVVLVRSTPADPWLAAHAHFSMPQRGPGRSGSVTHRPEQG
jgi:hypothetical protein